MSHDDFSAGLRCCQCHGCFRLCSVWSVLSRGPWRALTFLLLSSGVTCPGPALVDKWPKLASLTREYKLLETSLEGAYHTAAKPCTASLIAHVERPINLDHTLTLPYLAPAAAHPLPIHTTSPLNHVPWPSRRPPLGRRRSVNHPIRPRSPYPGHAQPRLSLRSFSCLDQSTRGSSI